MCIQYLGHILCICILQRKKGCKNCLSKVPFVFWFLFSAVGKPEKKEHYKREVTSHFLKISIIRQFKTNNFRFSNKADLFSICSLYFGIDRLKMSVIRKILDCSCSRLINQQCNTKRIFKISSLFENSKPALSFCSLSKKTTPTTSPIPNHGNLDALYRQTFGKF